MGYSLHGFIGEKDVLSVFDYQNAKLIHLFDKLYLIPLTGELFDEVNDFRTNNGIEKFELLTTDIENEILKVIGDRMLSYVEAEYFGGEGGQSGIMWKNGKRIFHETFSKDTINKILKEFGIKNKLFKDRFDTVGLGKYRNTDDWK